MVSQKSVEEQLKRISFNGKAWGRAEINELPHILLEDEEIHECVNGMYEGGFALLVATNFRLLLIDKKPLNYLTVEDMRFDMINEIDYSHRLLGARITVSAGNKTLQFRSYNQQRLRKLIGHVQHGMADAKKKQSAHAEDQNQHLEKINQQLQAYLLAQHAQQEEMRKKLEKTLAEERDIELPPPPKPGPELNDFLLAQRLLEQVKDVPAQPAAQAAKAESAMPPVTPVAPSEPAAGPVTERGMPVTSQMMDLYTTGMQEIYGRARALKAAALPSLPLPPALEVNPLRIAYSKLPMALRQRRFGRPSLRMSSYSAPFSWRPGRPQIP